MNMRKSTASVLALIGALGVGALLGPAEAQTRPVASEMTAVVSIAGSYSGIERREYHRITDAETWVALWTNHRGQGVERDSYGQAVIPTIDFEKYMVIAIFRGKAWNCRSEQLFEIAEVDNGLQLRFDAQTYQTNGPTNESDHTTSYGIWVVPRMMQQITLQENVQGLLGRPPKWKTQHRFDQLPR